MIAGLGSIGRRHLRNLIQLGEQDILLYRTTATDAVYPPGLKPVVETDLQAALAHSPQAVIIANPTSLHLNVAIPAAEMGCTILLEKPVSHSLEHIDSLQAALARGGGQALVGYQFRFHPSLQKIVELLAEGAIGRPISFRSHWGEYLPGWHPWEDYRQGYSARADLGGGVVLTLSHPLDYLRWLFGDVHSAWAYTGHLSDLQLDVEDTAEISLQFASGVLGSVHLDYYQQPPSHHLEIIGTQGTIRWNYVGQAVSLTPNDGGAVELYRVAKTLRMGTTENIEPLSFKVPNGFERNDMFLAEMKHFLAVARGEAQPTCTLEDGIAALRLALAIHQSAMSGQRMLVATV